MSVLNEFLVKVITQIIDPIVLLLATGAFVYFLWGVYQFIRHAADQKQDEGRRAILWGIVGLGIIFGAYGIVNLALDTFNLNTQGGVKTIIQGK